MSRERVAFHVINFKVFNYNNFKGRERKGRIYLLDSIPSKTNTGYALAGPPYSRHRSVVVTAVVVVVIIVFELCTNTLRINGRVDKCNILSNKYLTLVLFFSFLIFIVAVLAFSLTRVCIQRETLIN
ncbi:hypothetical protein PUN28_011087 [Cardiocondyla obscurior]|uniref:Uncharacterized protein n=1 Tax=Cardiocondyla obscurior TaxID=286306 RepID=A0AAW2FNK0_9HYME